MILKNPDCLVKSNWPNKSLLKDDLCFTKRLIRPVIKIQKKANPIIAENWNWSEKLLKIRDLTKADFKEYMKKLDLSLYEDSQSFYKILNSIVRYRNKGKIVRGIRLGEEIIFGQQKDKIIINQCSFPRKKNSKLKKMV